jgi:hypothetical protein
MMTDAELEVFLGIAGTKECAAIMAKITPEERASYERTADLVMELKLWQEGVGPKPKGVIICGCKRCSPPKKGRKR